VGSSNYSEFVSNEIDENELQVEHMMSKDFEHEEE
jgi:hypothetical protein